MGKTAFSGPVYGAKALLCVFGPALGDQNTSTALAFAHASRPVPPYEDWFITEVLASASTYSSAAMLIALKSEGGSTTIPARTGYASTVAQTIASFTSATSTTLTPTLRTITASAGEYEGLYVPAGSTLRVVSSQATTIGNLSVSVSGYIRYIDSTRAV